MNFKQFVDYMEERLSNKPVYYENGLAEQKKKNRRRAPAKRWSDDQMEHEVDKEWRGQLEKVYDVIQAQIKRDLMDPQKPWLDFINEYNIVDGFNEDIAEITFGNEF